MSKNHQAAHKEKRRSKSKSRHKSKKEHHHHHRHHHHHHHHGRRKSPQEVTEAAKSKGKERLDRNACGDGLESPRFHNKEVKCADDNSSKPARERSVRHQSLEKPENILSKTKYLFRKEKSFNDALPAAPQPVARVHKHRNRGSPRKDEPEAAVNKVLKRRAGEKSPQDAAQKPEAMGRVQEVIFCQMNQVPYKMKNDKTIKEVKDLYRRTRRRNMENASNSHPKRALENDVFRQENPKQYVVQRTEIEPKRPLQPPKSSEQAKETRHHHHHHGQHSTEDRGVTNENNRHHHHHHHHHQERTNRPLLKNEYSQVEEQKIHKIIESDLKTYFSKIQTLIDKKLDAIVQINVERKKKNREQKEARKRSKSMAEEKLKERETIIKEDIVNEVLKRLKAGQGGEDAKKVEEQPRVVEEQQPYWKVQEDSRFSGTVKDRHGLARHDHFLVPPVMKPFNSGSSCKTFSDGKPRRPEAQPIYSASEETVRPKYHKSSRRSSSPGNYCTACDTKIRTFKPPQEQLKNRSSSSSEKTRHEFIVQGVEPPVLESAVKKVCSRKFECKTMSIVAIYSRNDNVEEDACRSKQRRPLSSFHSNYATLSSDCEYVSRKTKEEVQLVVLDAKKVDAESCAVSVIKPPKRYKPPYKVVAVPEDSYCLNNITEESSDNSGSRPGEYFVPLAGTTKQYYCKAVASSSNSDYCFAVDKKRASSDISLRSRGTEDVRYVVNYEYECSRHLKSSKSELKLTSNPVDTKQHSQQTYVSSLDVADKKNAASKRSIELIAQAKKDLSKKPRLTERSKKCQTGSGTDWGSVVQRNRFKEIYKTIDSLEENIARSRTVDTRSVEVGAVLEEPDTYKKNVEVKVEKVDASTGSVKAPKKDAATVQVLDTAVGNSSPTIPENTPRRKPITVSPETRGKRYASSAVSPIRALAEEPQVVADITSLSTTPKKPAKKTYQPVNIHPKDVTYKPIVARVCTPQKTSSDPPPSPKPTATEVKQVVVKKPVRKVIRNDPPKRDLLDCVKVFRSRESHHRETCFYQATPRRGTARSFKSKPIIVSTATTDHKVRSSSSSSSVSEPPKEAKKSQSLTDFKSGVKNDAVKSKSVCGLKETEDMEKYRTKPTLRCPSKSQASSLDHYFKAKVTSRLFLTKDFKGESLSSYEKRKLYDQTRRSKLKTKPKTVVDVGPQVFEVRFMSTQNEPPEVKPKVDALKAKECDLIFERNDDDRLSTVCKNLFSINQLLRRGTVKNPLCTCTTQAQCPGCKNLNRLIHELYSSLLKYQPKVEEIFSTSCKNRASSSDSITVPSTHPLDPVECLSRETADEVPGVQPRPISSCPNLNTNCDSFEFLYEDNDTTFLADLLKPISKQYNVEETLNFFAKLDTTKSTESGYSSIKSKSCSLIDFFKRPDMVALVKGEEEKVEVGGGDSRAGISEVSLSSSRLLSMSCLSGTCSSPPASHGYRLVFPNEYLNTHNVLFVDSAIVNGNTERADSKNTLVELYRRLPSSSFSSIKTGCGTDAFFETLIKAQERETTFCAKLFLDEAFGAALLETARARKVEEDRKKLESFCKFFGKRKKPVTVAAEEPKAPWAAFLELQRLAGGAKRCFSMLADAVMTNANIDKNMKICSLLKVLDRLEKGDFQLKTNEDQVDWKEETRTQITKDFLNVYDICVKEAKKCRKRPRDLVQLIRTLVIKNRAALLCQSGVLASAIGRGKVHTDEELEAMVTVVVRASCRDVDRKELDDLLNKE